MLKTDEDLSKEIKDEMQGKLKFIKDEDTLFDKVCKKIDPLVKQYTYIEQVLSILATDSPQAFPNYTEWYKGDLPADVSKYVLNDDVIRYTLTRMVVILLGDNALVEEWSAPMVISLAFTLYIFKIMGFTLVPAPPLFQAIGTVNKVIQDTNIITTAYMQQHKEKVPEDEEDTSVDGKVEEPEEVEQKDEKESVDGTGGK